MWHRRKNEGFLKYVNAYIMCFTAMVVVAAVGLVLDAEDVKPYGLLLVLGIFATFFLALFADNILKKK